jgi:hypothetical protein
MYAICLMFHRLNYQVQMRQYRLVFLAMRIHRNGELIDGLPNEKRDNWFWGGVLGWIPCWWGILRIWGRLLRSWGGSRFRSYYIHIIWEAREIIVG